MEYVYTALLLHAAKKPVDEAHVSKVLEAAGVHADPARVKALVASLQEVNIEEAIKTPAVSMAMPAAPAAAGHDAKADHKKSAEDDKKTEEEAAAGLGALFG
ncbi:MAG: 50S ribosomal protein P1 [archaeon]|nr:50S ribosomal protein P1 [archaeon]